MTGSPQKLIGQLIQHVNTKGGPGYSKERSIPTDGQWVAIGLFETALSRLVETLPGR